MEVFIEFYNNLSNIELVILWSIVFTFIILISSAVRMYFYESAYGYTTLRLLVYAILATEAILLMPTIMFVIDKKINLVKTYFTIILSAYVITNLVNINDIITQRNVSRFYETGKLDVYYLKKEIEKCNGKLLATCIYFNDNYWMIFKITI